MGTTLTAAQIAGLVITRSGPTAAFNDTTDTAANIIGALTGAFVGQSFEISIVNTTAFPLTLLAGSGVTLSGLAMPVPANSTCRLLLIYATATSVSLAAIDMDYNAAGGANPSTEQTFFGGGAGTFPEEGNLNRQVSAAGVSPAATGADKVIAVYSLPAGSFDQALRGLTITAAGSFASNGNTKDVKIIFNPTAAVVGSTVGSGGTTIADTAAVTTNGGGWELTASVFKYGALGSNTQLGIHNQAQVGGAVAALLAPTAITATESGAILIAVTANCTTTATDVVFNWLEVNAMN